MRSLNRVTLLGNVGNEPEIRRFDGGSMVATLSIATSKKYKNKQGETIEETEWHNLEAWNKSAEIIEKYVKKGSRLYVEGELKSRSWDGENGEKRYKTFINVRDFSLMDRPQSQGQNQAPRQESPAYAQPVPGSYEQEDDDLPF